jgi:exopolyphosphatase/guanosine-5'-triphosphate,3'-diphosphate pyrophosphatase
MTDPDQLELRDKAVIDVGSNSVRLVIFRTNATFFQPIFNEKVTASLGRGVMETGLLNPKGVIVAQKAIIRFMRILKARDITNVRAVATAAVRDSTDGQDFLDQITKDTGLMVRKLSGKEEAHLSALGLIAGEPEVQGLMADLGGSSLELVSVADGRPGKGTTRKLGPLAMGAENEFDQAEVLSKVKALLQDVAPITGSKNERNLYAVGGAWRALATVHMALCGYPLKVLHNYQISAKEAKRLARMVQSQSSSFLAKLPGISVRRATTLPYAALLLLQLLKKTNARNVVISSFGLREGLLYDGLSKLEAARHPVLASVEALAQQNWSTPEFGQAAQAWLRPVFDHSPEPFGKKRTKMLQVAICQLADIGARMHPDHRAEIAFDLILFAPFAGLTHAERATLALAVFHRCAGPSTPPRVSLLMRLTNEDMRAWATAVGLGLRCAAAVSGRTKSLLNRTTLSRKGGELLLDAHEEESALLTSNPARRLEDLAAAMKLQAKVID